MLVATLTLLFGSSALLDGQTITEVVTRADLYQEQGGYVTILRARWLKDDTDTTVNSAECAGLQQSPGVVAAGPLSDLGRDAVLTAPGAQFRVLTTTPDGLRALAGKSPLSIPSPHRGPQPLIASELLAKELGLEPGRTIATNQGHQGVVAGLVTPRSASSARSLIAFQAASGSAQACWVETNPADFDTLFAALPGGLSTVDSVVSPQRLVDAGSDFAIFDPSRELDSRQTRFLPLIVGIAGAVVISFGLWLRRSTVGMYRAMSLNWSTVVWIQAAEAFTTIWLAFLLALSWAAFGLAVTAEPTWPTLAFTLRSATGAIAVCGAGTLVGALILTRGSVMNQLKDR